MSSRTPAGNAFSAVAVQLFLLGARLELEGDTIAGVAKQTSARWRVLAALEGGPATVAAMARRLNLKRQSVQRIADDLADEGVLLAVPNPGDARASLMSLSASGAKSPRPHSDRADRLGEPHRRHPGREAADRPARRARPLAPHDFPQRRSRHVMSLTTYSGSCHCGRLKFEADIDFEKGTGKCNCSFCFKARMWAAQIRPAQFRLLAGEESISDYQKNPGGPHHLFCSHCGVRPFEKGNIPEAGGEFVSINVSCLDGVDPKLLSGAPVRYFDGLNNNWWNKPELIAHL